MKISAHLMIFVFMLIRFAEISEYPEVLKHYEACGYRAGVQDEDIVVIAIDEQLMGAVRICSENGFKVLRGMYIKQSSQKKGIGSAMLKFLADNLDLDGCYCLPYAHLKKFYGLIGFKEIPQKEAPEFLSERLKKYLSKGSKDIIVMRKESESRAMMN